jgi:hypothetical protein
MKWFGKPGGAPYEADCPHMNTPVGLPCAWCDESITEDDDGVVLPGGAGASAFHYECHLRQVVGGLNHLRGNCTCCGGAEPPDPPWLTRRQAAAQAASVWYRGRG